MGVDDLDARIDRFLLAASGPTASAPKPTQAVWKRQENFNACGADLASHV
jgi:hypothetical protein